jgi:uncharacterized protein (DUF362 family)
VKIVHKWRSSIIQILKNNFFLLGLISITWFLFRTGRKPSRASYPCQQTAALNSNLWLTTYIFPVFSVENWKDKIKKSSPVILILLILISAVVVNYQPKEIPQENETIDIPQNNKTNVEINLNNTSTQNLNNASQVTPLLNETNDDYSKIFVIKGTLGLEDEIQKIIDLMDKNGLHLYNSSGEDLDDGTNGLISADDVVLIKVNCQWDQRGGTNTDLVKSIIQKILDHPDGFKGEIVVADNGQSQYGAFGEGGSLDWEKNNAINTSQSIEDVVNSFSDEHKVSTYLWDSITKKPVQEYLEGDMNDGYIVNTTIHETTDSIITYPKFKTKFGTFISFKHGIWDSEKKEYLGNKLKVINVPVLKTHLNYGVTASVKHYMGVPSDYLSKKAGKRIHDKIGNGAMGTLMAETRFPTLNIIDAIWINAYTEEAYDGPRSKYNIASQTNIIAASVDPIALDYWSSKYILSETCKSVWGQDTSSIDPDSSEPGSFGEWLRLSKNELVKAGYQVTLKESEMKVFIDQV